VSGFPSHDLPSSLPVAAFAALAFVLALQAPAQHGHDHAPAKQGLTLRRDPIAALGWPAMTLTFADPALPQDLKVGDRGEFDLKDERPSASCGGGEYMDCMDRGRGLLEAVSEIGRSSR
jgi:hypothetical protein